MEAENNTEVAPSRGFNQSILQDDEETQQARREFFEAFEPQDNLTQRREKEQFWLEQDLKLKQKQEDATWSQKAVAQSFNYETNSIVGRLLQKIGWQSELVTPIDKDDYEKQEGYEPPQDMIISLANEVGLQPKQIEELVKADSPDYFTALSTKFRKDSFARQFVNETLTRTQQTVSNVSSVFDVDLLAPTGLAFAGVRGLKLGRAGVNMSSAGAGALAGARPYIVENANIQGRSDSDLLFEAILGGALEFGATKFLTPEIRRAGSKEIGQTAGRTQYSLDTQLINEVDGNTIKSWSSNQPENFILYPQRLSDDGLKTAQKIESGALDNTYKEMQNIVENIKSKKMTLDEAVKKIDELEALDENAWFIREVKNNVKKGLIKPLSDESKSILEKYKNLKSATPEEVVESVKKIRGTTEADKLMRDSINFNARETAKRIKGTTSNQLTKYFREIKTQLKDLQTQYSDILRKDEVYLNHLQKGDYEDAVLRAEEITDPKASRAREARLNEPKIVRETKEPQPLDTATPEGAILKEIEDITNTYLNKSGVRAKIGAYSMARDDIGKMFQDIFDGMVRNGMESIDTAFHLKQIRDEINSFVDALKKSKTLSPKTITKLQRQLNKSLSEMDMKAYNKDAKVKVEAINKLLTQIRKNPKLLKKHGNYAPVAKAEKLIASTKKKISDLQVKLRKALTTKTSQAETRKLTQELSKKETQLAKYQKQKTNAINKQIDKIKNDALEQIDDTVVIEKISGNRFKIGKKVIAGSVVAGLFGTSAFADDGELEGSAILSGFESFVILSVLLAMGYSGYRSRQISKTIQKRVQNAEKSAEAIDGQAKVMDRVSEVMRGNYENARSAFNETFAPIKKFARATNNEQLEKFINDVLVNPMEGKSNVAELIKENIMEPFNLAYRNAEEKYFKEWLDQQGLTFREKMQEKVTGAYREAFREYVTTAKDNVGLLPETGVDSIKAMADESTRLLEDTVDKWGKRLGLEGTEDLSMLKEYVKRSYRQNAIDVIGGLDEPSFARLKETYKNMYKAAVGGTAGTFASIAKKLPKTLDEFGDMASIKKYFDDKLMPKVRHLALEDDELQKLIANVEKAGTDNAMKKSVSEMVEYVSKMSTDDVATKKINKYFDTMLNQKNGGGIADVFSSFKARVPLDLTKFDTFKGTSNGMDIDIGIKTLLDRNDFSLTQSYMNQLSGRASLKAVDYSMDDVDNILKNIKGDERIKKMTEDSVRALLGQPLFHIDPKVQTALATWANSSVAMAFPLVGLSFLQEIMYGASRALVNPREMGQLANNFVASLRKYGGDSAMVQAIRRMGLGVNRQTGNVGSRIDVDMRMAGITTDESNTGLNASKMLRDGVFRGFGMLFLSDMIETMTGVMNMQRLYDLAQGTKKLSPELVTKYGLTESDYNIARKFLKVNKRGYVKEVDWEKMSVDEEMQLKNIIRNMGQTGAQRHTIGGTPAWTRDTALGTAASKLLMYPINAYANMGLHQLKGISHGSMETSLQVFGGYMGSYIGLKLRDEILGKERNEEIYHLYSTMNIASLAPFSVARGLTDPAMLSAPSTVMEGFSGFLRGAISGN